MALLRYVAVEPDARLRDEATKAVLASLQFELAITREVANPFGYARQYVKDLGKGKRSAFFFPHRNESGYWWEGESARLASLAAAAFLGGRHAPPEMRRELEAYAADQLDWTFGLNPFDTCMQRGQGRNTPDYSPDWPSAPAAWPAGSRAASTTSATSPCCRRRTTRTRGELALVGAVAPARRLARAGARRPAGGARRVAAAEPGSGRSCLARAGRARYGVTTTEYVLHWSSCRASPSASMSCRQLRAFDVPAA